MTVRPLVLYSSNPILIDSEGSIPTPSIMSMDHCRKPRQIHRKILLFFEKFTAKITGVYLGYIPVISNYRCISRIYTCNLQYTSTSGSYPSKTTQIYWYICPKSELLYKILKTY